MHHLGEPTVWDESFEDAFQLADDNFPKVIDWLGGLKRECRLDASTMTDRYVPQKAPEDLLSLLVEGMVSLAVRSPMNREAAVRLAEELRGPLPERERNLLIGLNIRFRQREVVDTIGTRGKFAILYSQDREFIFGDGFFHNITSPSQVPLCPKIVVPVTPEMCVVYAKPMAYSTEPRLATPIVDADETKALNDAVQVYARKALFYRTEKPTILDAFEQECHLEYSHPSNPVDSLISTLPGV